VAAVTDRATVGGPLSSGLWVYTGYL